MKTCNDICLSSENVRCICILQKQRSFTHVSGSMFCMCRYEIGLVRLTFDCEDVTSWWGLPPGRKEFCLYPNLCTYLCANVHFGLVQATPGFYPEFRPTKWLVVSALTKQVGRELPNSWKSRPHTKNSPICKMPKPPTQETLEVDKDIWTTCGGASIYEKPLFVFKHLEVKLLTVYKCPSVTCNLVVCACIHAFVMVLLQLDVQHWI